MVLKFPGTPRTYCKINDIYRFFTEKIIDKKFYGVIRKCLCSIIKKIKNLKIIFHLSKGSQIVEIICQSKKKVKVNNWSKSIIHQSQ